MSMQTSFGELTPNRFWFATNVCHSSTTPVAPLRPYANARLRCTQLSLSLTSTQPADDRLRYFVLASRSGTEQSVPPPP